jgi:hypothetical protein
MDIETNINVGILAVCRDGVLVPLEPHGFAEGQQYRLLVVAQVALPQEDEASKLAQELEQRTTMLPRGQIVVNLLGIFANRGATQPDLSFEAMEAALEHFRQEQISEWDALEHRE